MALILALILVLILALMKGLEPLMKDTRQRWRPMRYPMGWQWWRLLSIWVLVLALWSGNFVHAQQALPPRIDPAVRAQLSNEEALLFFREEIRRFIERLATYARSIDDRFYILLEDGENLLVKVTDPLDPASEEGSRPAYAFIKSIDGIISKDVFPKGKNDTSTYYDKAPAKRMERLALARKEGIAAFLLDHSTEPAWMTSRFQELYAQDPDLIYGVAPPGRLDRVRLPKLPVRPFRENGRPILTLLDVKNYAIIGNSKSYGRVDEFAIKMLDNNYDLLITNVFHGRKPLSKRAVETLKYKKNGARRLVFARIDIASAARYDYFWQEHWQVANPEWIDQVTDHDPDKYRVKYWNPEWQNIIYGDTNSYIYGLMDQGYDGVVLSGLTQAYEFYEDPFLFMEIK